MSLFLKALQAPLSLPLSLSPSHLTVRTSLTSLSLSLFSVPLSVSILISLSLSFDRYLSRFCRSPHNVPNRSYISLKSVAPPPIVHPSPLSLSLSLFLSRLSLLLPHLLGLYLSVHLQTRNPPISLFLRRLHFRLLALISH